MAGDGPLWEEVPRGSAWEHARWDPAAPLGFEQVGIVGHTTMQRAAWCCQIQRLGSAYAQDCCPPGACSALIKQAVGPAESQGVRLELMSGFMGRLVAQFKSASCSMLGASLYLCYDCAVLCAMMVLCMGYTALGRTGINPRT